MITNLKQIETLSGITLTQKLGLGKHKGKHLWELPDDYLRYCAKNGYFDYDKVRTKIEESKTIKLIDPVKSVLPVYTESDLSDWLYPYQKRELMRFPGRSRIIINGCIGSGKTIMALELARLYGYRKTLIPVPKTVHSSWINKIMDRTKESYIRLNGCIDERTEILQNTNYTFYLINPESYMDFEADITKSKRSQELMSKKRESYKRLLESIVKARFEFNFFDESHLYLQNHSTSIYKSVKLALQYVPHPFLMTGTFFSEGREHRAVDQLHLVNPSLFGGKAITTIYKEWFFLDSYYKPAAIKPEFAPVLAKIIANNSMVIHPSELKLPKPVFETRDIEMRGDLLAAYIKAEKEMLLEIQNEDVKIPAQIAVRIRLRQISGGSVLNQRFKDNDKLKEMLNTASEFGDENFIVGCEFVDEILMCKEALEKKGYKCSVLYGEIKDVKRDNELNKFRNKQTQVLIMQNETGGVGVDNLQSVCRFWIVYSSCERSTVEDQWIGRIVRTGQPTNCVFIRLHHVRPDGKLSYDKMAEIAVNRKINRTEDMNKLILECLKSA